MTDITAAEIAAAAAEATEAPAPEFVTRAFYNNDYRRFAAALKKARTGRDGQLKPPSFQSLIDMAANRLATVFEADSLVVDNKPYPFVRELFVAGTQVPVPPAAVEASDAGTVVGGFEV